MRSAFSRRRRHLGHSQESNTSENEHQQLIGGNRDANESFFQPQAMARTMEAEEAEALSTQSKTAEEEEAQALTSRTMEEEEPQALSSTTAEEEEAQTLSTKTMEEEEPQALSSGITAEEEEAAQTLSTKTMEEEEPQALSSGKTAEEEEAQTLTSKTMEEEEPQALSCEKTAEEEEAQTTTPSQGASTATHAPSTATIASASFTNIPSGTLTPSFVGGVFRKPFRMNATFVPNAPYNASNGEYRQYVRGYFKRNGRVVPHMLCSNRMSPTTYHEDCAVSGGRTYKYGYRSIRFGNSYFDTPDQATGSKFHGIDSPGLPGRSGDRLEVKLEFIGKLIDKSDGTVHKTASWSVEGTATQP